MCGESQTTTMTMPANNSSSSSSLLDEGLDLVSSFNLYENTSTERRNGMDVNGGDIDLLFEPTPIAQDRVVIVQNVPPMRSIQHATSSSDFQDNAAFLDSLRNLLKSNDDCKNAVVGSSFSSDEKIQLAPLSMSPPSPSYSSHSSIFDMKPSTAIMGRPEAASSSSSAQQQLLSNHIELNSSNRSHHGSSTGDRRSSSSSTSSSTSLRNSHNEQWHQRYLELVEFREEIGHCLVPLYWPKNPSLAHWVKRQRYQHRMKHRENKHSTLTDGRQRMLEELGFVWDSHAAGWEERWNELREFKDQFGHCNVPKVYPENQQLSVWVKCQRRQAKLLMTPGQKSNMTRDRIEKLQSLGFVFDPRSKKKKMTMIDYLVAEQQHSV